MWPVVSLTVLIGLLCSVQPKFLPHFEAESEDLFNYINFKSNSTWKAGKNFEGYADPVAHVKRLCGVLEDPKGNYLPHMHYELKGVQLPDEFDPRKKWTNCPTLQEVRDQGRCGSCWAHGAVEAMSDRACILSNGKVNVHLSVEDVLSCCTSCGYGCNGGYPSAAWNFYYGYGIVTGGNYDSKKGCKSYSEAPYVQGRTPACMKKCDYGYNITYNKDKNFAKSAYRIAPNEDQIKYELITNGPVEAAFAVYQDFMSYKTGVYHHVTGSLVGYHAVKLMGYGKEGGIPYWLLANSWNTKWGDGGFFKMLRGRNECGIESSIVAGLPKV